MREYQTVKVCTEDCGMTDCIIFFFIHPARGIVGGRGIILQTKQTQKTRALTVGKS